MCDPGTLTIVAAAAAVAGTIASTTATVQQKRYEAKVAEANQQNENNRVLDALNRGETEAQNAARKQSQLAGAQRAAMAANGVDVSFGSAADLMADTAMYGREEQSNIRNNTTREVQGYDINAANFGGQANAARSAAKGAIVSGALQSVSTIAGAAQRFGSQQRAQTGATGWSG